MFHLCFTYVSIMFAYVSHMFYIVWLMFHMCCTYVSLMFYLCSTYVLLMYSFLLYVRALPHHWSTEPSPESLLNHAVSLAMSPLENASGEITPHNFPWLPQLVPFHGHLDRLDRGPAPETPGFTVPRRPCSLHESSGWHPLLQVPTVTDLWNVLKPCWNHGYFRQAAAFPGTSTVAPPSVGSGDLRALASLKSIDEPSCTMPTWLAPSCSTPAISQAALQVQQFWTLRSDKKHLFATPCHMAWLYNFAWCCIILYDNVWYSMILYDIAWYCMILHDVVWWCMMLYDNLWYGMILYHNLWLAWNRIIVYDNLWYSTILHDIVW